MQKQGIMHITLTSAATNIRVVLRVHFTVTSTLVPGHVRYLSMPSHVAETPMEAHTHLTFRASSYFSMSDAAPRCAVLSFALACSRSVRVCASCASVGKRILETKAWSERMARALAQL